jgi:predicted DNA repair protein MutK
VVHAPPRIRTTVGVTGLAALIARADQVGLAVATGEHLISAIFRRRLGQPSGAGLSVRPVPQAIGREQAGMSWILKVLAAMGTAAMLWVGVGIVVHGVTGEGLPGMEDAIHATAVAAAGAVAWLATAEGSGVVGPLVGAVLR